MDDLIPFLVFIVIALINLVKFVLERGAKDKKPPVEGEQPKQKSPLEDFFEDLSQKLDPSQKPVDMPTWPKGYEKPDYTAEQAAYEEYKDEEDDQPVAEIIPMPEPVRAVPIEDVQVEGIQVASLKSAMTAIPAMKSSFAGGIPSMPSMKSNSAGSIHFSLKKKSELRKAILAKVVLDPPRAFDASFENTAKR